MTRAHRREMPEVAAGDGLPADEESRRSLRIKVHHCEAHAIDGNTFTELEIAIPRLHFMMQRGVGMRSVDRASFSTMPENMSSSSVAL